MTKSIISTIGLVIALVGFVTVVLPFVFSSSSLIQDPTPENTQKVIEEGTQTLVEFATPWWFPLLGLGFIGVVIVVLIRIFAPELL